MGKSTIRNYLHLSPSIDKDVFIDEWETSLVEQSFNIYETGEIQEVIAFYKNKKEPK